MDAPVFGFSCGPAFEEIKHQNLPTGEKNKGFNLPFADQPALADQWILSLSLKLNVILHPHLHLLLSLSPEITTGTFHLAHYVHSNRTGNNE